MLRPAGTSRLLVPVLVFLGLVVAIVSSLGAPLVPTIATVDHVSLADAQWALTITLLVGAIATPTMGRLGDGPHRQVVVLGGLAAVTAGCTLSALPLSFGWLVLGRGLMGLGLGLTPLAMATAREAITDSRRTVALLSITTVAGVGLGYPITGLIAEHLSFHAAFWFGAIVSAAVLVAAALVMPASVQRTQHRLDVVGAIVLGAALGALVLVLSDAESWGWRSGRVLGLGAAGLALLALWAWYELRTPHPLVDLRVTRNRSVLTAHVTSAFAMVGMYLLMSLVIRYVQTPTNAGYGLGESVVVAGFVLLPLSVASIGASRLAPLIARRTSAVGVLPIGCGVFAVATLMFVFSRGSLWQVMLVMAVAGLGVGCSFAAIPGLIVGAVPAHETGSALSFNQVLRYVGGSVGSALCGSVLAAHTAPGHLLPAERGFDVSALIGCSVLAVAGVLSFGLGRRAGPDDELLAQESVADALEAEDMAVS